MQDARTVQVVINISITSTSACHWFVTSQEELQTVTWTDDGSTLFPFAAIDQALEVARSELDHLVRGGSIQPLG